MIKFTFRSGCMVVSFVTTDIFRARRLLARDFPLNFSTFIHEKTKHLI